MTDTKITPHDIITMLPFDKDFKVKLLAQLEMADEDKKFRIEEALWEAYDAMFEIVRNGHLDRQMAEAAEGKIELDKNFYKEALKKADQDMVNMAVQGNTSSELSAVREKLQELIK
jgi:hypothetical protein